MLLCHRSEKEMRGAETGSQDPNVGRQAGAQRAAEAKLWRPHAVPYSDQGEAVGQTVWKLVENSACRGGFAAFDRDHPIKKIAQKAKLNSDGAE